jgi:hypothetical protein
MWDPRRLTIVWHCAAYYSDNFTFYSRDEHKMYASSQLVWDSRSCPVTEQLSCHLFDKASYFIPHILLNVVLCVLVVGLDLTELS